MPGVALVLTGADTAELGDLPCQGAIPGTEIAIPPYPMLARDEVQHVGDAVAFVVADTLEQARDAAEAIAIEWEALPHVVGAAAALEQGRAAGLAERPRQSRVRDDARRRGQRPTRAFAKAARTVSLTLVNQRLVTNYLDTRGVVAEYDARPHHADARQPGQPRVRDVLCGDVLKIAPEKMRVVTPDVGGGFGTKLFPYREYALAAVAAQRSSARCKWIADRTEHFLGDAQGRDNITTAKLALDDDGRFLALDVDIVADMGAYLSCLRAVHSVSSAPACRPASTTSRPAMCALRGGLHQHGAGRCLSRRRPAGGGLCDRAAGRRRRARARHRARRVAAEEFHQAEGDALHDRDRQGLRLRRLRRRIMARAQEIADWDGFQEARWRARASARASCAASALRPISRPAATTAPTPRRVTARTTTAASPC